MSDYTPTAGIYTLGCKVNQYESEAIREGLIAEGFSILPPSKACDIYVINTCTVTGESDRKARQFIRRAVHQNPNAYILVTGCFSQVDPEAVSAINGVDYVCGNADKLSVVKEAVNLIKTGKKGTIPKIHCPAPDAFGFEQMQIKHFDRTRAYVKIEDGCESRCTYCIIPSARGKIRSKAPEDVIHEVKTLLSGGCREIVLTGIETASYGVDLNGYTLADLLYEIDRIPGICRIRLGSLDPSLMKQEFVDRIAGLSCLAPHFHLSMQSGSDTVLARMKRKYNTRMAREGIGRLKKAIPDVTFTTDMIVGFPGETEEEFEQSMDFAREIGFLMIHVFPYSKRKGTLAATMKDQVSEKVKHERVKRLSEVAEECRYHILHSYIGNTLSVLFETSKNGICTGHTKHFIPVSAACPASFCGNIHSVRIQGVQNDRLIGTPISDCPRSER